MTRVLRSLSFFQPLPHVNSTGVRTVVLGLSLGDTTWRSGQVTVNAAWKKSTYQRQRQKQQTQTKTPRPASPCSEDQRPRCPHCRLTEHTGLKCPAAGRVCNGCRGVGHFQSVCPKKIASSKPPKNRQLKLFRTSRTAAPKITVTEEKPSKFLWLPDTGSEVDAIGPQHLSKIGGFVKNLAEDPDKVLVANRVQLQGIGQIRATLTVGHASCETTIHVYDGLSDALLSCDTLRSLRFLPAGWLTEIRSVSSAETHVSEHPSAA